MKGKTKIFMKKRNLLVALGAMGAMAVAVGTVGTFAWYQVTQGAILANTYSDGGTVTVSNPSWSTTSTLQFSVNVEVTPETSTDLTLATWLTAAPTSPSSIRSGESFSEADLWTAWANGSAVSSGFTYTQKNNAGTEVLALLKILLLVATSKSYTHSLF